MAERHINDPVYDPIYNPVFKAFDRHGSLFTPADIDGLLLDINPLATKARGTGSRQFTAVNSEELLITDAAQTGLDGGTSHISFGCFIYIDSLASNRTIVSKGQYSAGAGNPGFWFHVASGVLTCHFSDGSAARLTATGSTLVAGQWYHVAFVADRAGNLTIYLNGVSDGTVSIAAQNGDMSNSIAFEIGAASTANYWGGRIARSWFYLAQLGVAAIRSLFNKGNGLRHNQLTAAQKTNLTSYWDLDEQSGNALDSQGSNDLTDTNTVTAQDGPASINVEDSSTNENHGIWTGDPVTGWLSSVAHGEQAGRADDSTSNNKHAILRGVSALNTDKPTVLTGNSLQFDGVDDYTEADANTDPSGLSGFTVSFWLKALVDPPTDVTVAGDWGGAANRPWRFRLRNGLSLQAQTNDSNGLAGFVISTNTWYHVALTWTNTSLKLYVDAVERAEDTTLEASLDPTSGKVVIGRDGTASSDYANVRVKDLRIFTVEKTPTEITALKNGTDDTTSLDGKWLLGDTISAANLDGGLCLDFDGVDDQVNIGADKMIGLVAGSTAMTFGGWLKIDTLDAASDDNRVVDFTIDGTNAFALLNIRGDGGNAGKVRVGARSKTADSLQTATSANAINDGLWHRVDGIVDFANDEIAISVDGVIDPVTSVAFGSTTLLDDGTPTGDDSIGARGGASNPFDGTIDDIRIYGSELTAANVESLYKGIDVGTPDGHWKMDDGPQASPSDSMPIAILSSSEGKNYDFAQSTQSKRPLWRSGPNGINGRPAIEFDGVTQLLEFLGDLQDQTSAIEILAVGRLLSTNNEELAIISTADVAVANKYWLMSARRNDLNPVMNVRSVDGATDKLIRGSTTIATAVDRLLVGSANGTATALEVDGNDETETVEIGADTGVIPTDIAGRDNWTLGAWKGNSEDNHLPGKIARICVYDHVLTDDEREDFETLVNTIYGITIS